MKPLNVQFVSKVSVWTYALAALGLAGLLLTGAQGVHAWHLHQQSNAIWAAVGALQGQETTLSQSLQRNRRAPPYQAGALQAIREAQFELEPALARLEEVSVPGVKVVALNFALGDDTASAELEAQNPEALGKYLQQLAPQADTAGWRLAKVQAASEGGSAVGPLGLVNQIPPGLPPLLPQPSPNGAPAAVSSSTAMLVWTRPPLRP